MDFKVILIIAAVIALIFVYVVIREKINVNKAATGEDFDRLKKAVAKVLPAELGYRLAYGHYEHVVHAGRRTTTTYYSYGVAFTADRLWIVPLGFEKDLILPGEPILLTSDALGVADVEVAANKADEPRMVGVTLYDKGGKRFLDCIVEVENTREDRFHHLNILQPEETAQFARFMTAMSHKVSRENEGLKEKVYDQENSLRRASILGTIGTVCAFILPPIGLILGIVGMRSVRRDPGEKAPAPLILCRVAAIVSAVFLVFWIVAVAAAMVS